MAERPGDGHLRRQMLRVYQADIKTVDAFCAGLLRENVHLLPPVEEHSLTPDFRVLDEQEAALLRQRVLGRVLEDFYAGIEEDENARLLAETLGAGRDDRALEALVLDLHQKTQSHPHPLRWLEELKRDWARTPEHLPDTGCGRYLMEDALRKADFWSRRLKQAVEDMEDYPPCTKPTATGSWRQPRPWNTCGTRRNRAGTAWDRRSPYSAGWEPSGAMKTPPAGTGPRRCWSSAKRH